MGKSVMVRRGLWPAIAAVLIAVASSPSVAFDCPPALHPSTRLVLVTTSGMNAVAARVKLFERNSPADSWSKSADEMPAVVGKNGLGWGVGYGSSASKGEPIKVESDGRSPAGVFLLGRPFGFGPRKIEGYTRLEKGQQFCIDDPRSPQYNSIASGNPGGITGEDMGTIPEYRSGMFVEYPTDRKARGGSCIFLHVWKGKDSGTAGCIALRESDIERIQSWTLINHSVIAILPESRMAQFQKCITQPAR